MTRSQQAGTRPASEHAPRGQRALSTIDLVLPATTALAQEAGRCAAGAADAMQGGLSFPAGALVTPLTGVLG